ncbi:flavohemoglobin expression-modulating QEGLA motif protein [Thermomonas brevis]
MADSRRRPAPPAFAPFGRDEAWLHALPDGGRAYIDRPLPFVVLSRYDDDGLGIARRVATISASGIVWPDQPQADHAAMDTLRTVLAIQRKAGQQFLVVTLYDLPMDLTLDDASARLEPFRFVLGASADAPAQAAARGLAAALADVEIDLRKPKVESVEHAPEEPAFAALLDGLDGVSQLSLGLPQIHRVRGGDGLYPQIRDALESASFDAVLQTCAAFVAATRPDEDARHHRSYGRSRLVEAALRIDKALDGISRSFDFLLGVSPINTADAYDQFIADKCAKPPTFRYRPLTVSPEQAKRTLYDIDAHAAEDPVLEQLFSEKRREIDLQLLLLQQRNSAAFKHASILLYGPIEPALLDLAGAILAGIAPGSRPPGDTTALDCHAVERAAKLVIGRYRKQAPGFDATVCLREDIGMGLMVSGTRLLVSTATRLPRGRLDALLQHEIGVHLVTAVNGNRQPLGIFGSGLAGYEGLQEGLGVFAEFLVDGLTDARLRLLAARVLVVDAMLAGAGFVEAFALLRNQHAFSPRAAFNIVARVYRSGGLTKDAIYLRGLLQVFDYVTRGGDLAPLWLGKIAEHHLPVVEELRQRGLLRPALVDPEFLSRPVAKRQLQRLRNGTPFIELVLESPTC